MRPLDVIKVPGLIIYTAADSRSYTFPFLIVFPFPIHFCAETFLCVVLDQIEWVTQGHGNYLWYNTHPRLVGDVGIVGATRGEIVRG